MRSAVVACAFIVPMQSCCALPTISLSETRRNDRRCRLRFGCALRGWFHVRLFINHSVCVRDNNLARRLVHALCRCHPHFAHLMLLPDAAMCTTVVSRIAEVVDGWSNNFIWPRLFVAVGRDWWVVRRFIARGTHVLQLVHTSRARASVAMNNGCENNSPTVHIQTGAIRRGKYKYLLLSRAASVDA